MIFLHMRHQSKSLQKTSFRRCTVKHDFCLSYTFLLNAEKKEEKKKPSTDFVSHVLFHLTPDTSELLPTTLDAAIFGCEPSSYKEFINKMIKLISQRLGYISLLLSTLPELLDLWWDNFVNPGSNKEIQP